MRTLGFLVMSLIISQASFARGERDTLDCKPERALNFSAETPQGKSIHENITQLIFKQNSDSNYVTTFANGKEVSIDGYQRSKAGMRITVGGWQSTLVMELRPIKSSGMIETGNSTKAYAKYTGDIQEFLHSALVKINCDLSIK